MSDFEINVTSKLREIVPEQKAEVIGMIKGIFSKLGWAIEEHITREGSVRIARPKERAGEVPPYCWIQEYKKGSLTIWGFAGCHCDECRIKYNQGKSHDEIMKLFRDTFEHTDIPNIRKHGIKCC